MDQLFGALANPTRRDILDALLARERSVSELAGMFDMSQPSVSEHLRTLRENSLVDETRSGRHRLYRVTGKPLGDLLDWLTPYERFWRDRLANLGEVLDRMSDDA